MDISSNRFESRIFIYLGKEKSEWGWLLQVLALRLINFTGQFHLESQLQAETSIPTWQRILRQGKVWEVSKASQRVNCTAKLSVPYPVTTVLENEVTCIIKEISITCLYTGGETKTVCFSTLEIIQLKCQQVSMEAARLSPGTLIWAPLTCSHLIS